MSYTALVLHGGGGPATVGPIASHLAGTFDVIAPTHPGWNDTAPVDGDTIQALAARYLDDLTSRGVRDALIVGSSIGGWIAAEIAILDAARDKADRVIGQLVLIDTVGADVPGHPLRDVSALTPRQLAEFAWADPDRGFTDPATLTPERLATIRGNMTALALYAGGSHTNDPQLLARLAAVSLPTLVIWGDADRMVTVDYGRAVASAVPNSTFVIIENAGHLPHLEQPQSTFDALDEFVALTPGR
ncbi:alpha/beta hydrolase [Subtercola vilae]|uniref:Alpha/beta hydrolase n=1 Tax=Subtercola vilae TaxID=2056433 RepID=A0A4T2BH76_9MICO|nr:alpha/beta hydrolase [Subtercola vilae]